MQGFGEKDQLPGCISVCFLSVGGSFWKYGQPQVLYVSVYGTIGESSIFEI